MTKLYLLSSDDENRYFTDLKLAKDQALGFYITKSNQLVELSEIDPLTHKHIKTIETNFNHVE